MPKLTVNDTKKKLQEAMRASKDADNFVEIYTDKTYDVTDEAVKAGYTEGFLGLHDTMLSTINFDNEDDIELLSDPKAFAKSIEDAYAATLNFEGAVKNLRTKIIIMNGKVGAMFEDADRGITIAHSDLAEDTFLMSPANSFVYDVLRTGVRELTDERTANMQKSVKTFMDMEESDPAVDVAKVWEFSETLPNYGNVELLNGAGAINITTNSEGIDRLSRFDISGETFENLDMDADFRKKIFVSMPDGSDEQVKVTYVGFDDMDKGEVESAILQSIDEALHNYDYSRSEFEDISGMDAIKAFSVQKENRKCIVDSKSSDIELHDELVSEKENSFDKGLGE